MATLTKPQQEWVTALRSGKYKQGKYVLHNATDNSYCCLGVACDLYNKRFPGELSISVLNGVTYFGRCKEKLPDKVATWLGLTFLNGLHYHRYGKFSSLSKLNDTEDYSFKQIADIIESKPEGLFIE